MHNTMFAFLFARVCVRRFIPVSNQRLPGLVVWLSLQVRETPGSIPGAAMSTQPQTLPRRVRAYLLAGIVQTVSSCCRTG